MTCSANSSIERRDSSKREVAEGHAAQHVVRAQLVDLGLQFAQHRLRRARDGAAVHAFAVELGRIHDADRLGAVVEPELHEARLPAAIAAPRDRHRGVVGVGNDEMAGEAGLRAVRGAPFVVLPVVLDQRARDRGRRVGDDAHAGRGRPLDALRRAGAVPQRRMRLLQRLDLDRHVLEIVELTLEIERSVLQPAHQAPRTPRSSSSRSCPDRCRNSASRSARCPCRCRTGSARRSSGRACRFPRSAGSGDRAAACRPAARN